MKEELIPETDPNYRKPRGKGFVIRAYVDSDHAGDSVTRRSRTGFVALVNSAPIYWFSKKQVGIETSTFGSEFIGAKIALNQVINICTTLLYLGVFIKGKIFFFRDNLL